MSRENSESVIQGPSARTFEAHANQAKNHSMTSRGHRRTFKVSTSEKILFFQNLGLMQEAGVGIISALDTLSNETPDGLITVSARRRQMSKKLTAEHVAELFKEGPTPEKRRLAATLRRSGLERVSALLAVSVSEGHRLSEAMSQYPEVFSEQELQLVRVGEETGSLPQTLKSLAQDTLTSYQRFLNLRKELYAPFFTLVAALAFFLVIPGLLFDSLIETGMMNSGYGYLLVKSSKALTSPAFVAFFGCALLVSGLWLKDHSRRKKAVSRLWSLARFFPPVNKIFHLRRSLVFTQSFRLLQGAGVPLLRALELAVQSCADEELSGAKEEILEGVKSGGTIAESLRLCQVEVLPGAALSLLAVGEESGKISKLLDTAVFLMGEELDQSVRDLTVLVNPLVMAFVGLVILFLGVSVFQSVSAFGVS